MRPIHKQAVLLALLMVLSGCGSRAGSEPGAAAPVHTPQLSAGAEADPPLVQPATSGQTAGAPPQEASASGVPMAEVSQMSQATHERPYTVEWELRGNIDTSRQGNWMLADTKGRAGVLLNGDRYVQLAYTGFVHKGDQAWYLRVKADGSWFSEGPEQGGLHQRPGIMMWEGIQPDQLGVLDAIARSRGSFRRTSVLPDLEVWTSAIPPRKSSVDLFKSPREVVEFNITVKKFGEVSLPIKFHLTWWDFGTIISFDGAYDWNPPVFPQVSEKAVMADAPWG